MRKASEALNALLAHNRSEAKALSFAALNRARTRGLTLLVVAVVSIVATVTLCVVLTLSIVGPLKKGVAFARSVADGDMEPITDAQTFTAVFEPTPGQAPLRLDVFWTNRLAEQAVTRARIQEAITAGNAWVDGQVCRKSGCKLRGGERLRLDLPETACPLTAEDAPLRILYRDASLLVLDKPPGLTVHPAPGLPDGTLVNRLLHHCPELRDLAGPRPGIVHRLDKDTSGLLVVALTEASRTALAATFADRAAHKTYLALVHGRPERTEGVIREPIGRDPDHPTRMQDLEMIEELGYCNGIENYSRHLDGRSAGQPPYTLLDYFPEDFILFVDESHITVPQIGGMPLIVLVQYLLAATSVPLSVKFTLALVLPTGVSWGASRLLVGRHKTCRPLAVAAVFGLCILVWGA